MSALERIDALRTRAALRRVHSVDDLRTAARRRLPKVAFDYIDGGADDEVTMRLNRRALQEQVLLQPRWLRGVEVRSQAVTVFGRRIASPVILGPAGLLRIAHLDGELAAARAAAAHGGVCVLSANASVELERVGREMPPGSLWFQLYFWRDRVRNAELLRRARAVGCEVLVVTVDAPVMGKRERDRRNGFTIPLKPSPGMALDLARHPGWVRAYLRGGPITFANFTEMGQGRKPTQIFKYINSELAHPGATLSDLAWLRDSWPGKLVIKGTMTAEDARAAVECGLDGVCVSNHGGRQIDGVPASIAALPAVVEAVGGRAEVFVDGGFRRGTDVLKALALGARAVLVGRPYVYGLGAGGQAGVERMLEIYRDEIDLALAMVGCPDIADLDSDAVRCAWR